LVLELKNVWEVCEFEDDIKYGRLEAARFAVELYSVLQGKADKVYTDPRLFLTHTYLAENMKYLLKEALRRLSGKGGQPVIVLDTEFGGGKTHTILLLYHVFKSRGVGTKFIQEAGLTKETEVIEVPECRVLAIDCKKLSKPTLWGEISHGLGRYNVFEDEDRNLKPVSDIGKLVSLLEEPTLILLDDLPHYLLQAEATKVGDTNLCILTIAFILMLISAVSSTKSSMLVIVLTGKQKLYEEYRQRLKHEIDELSVERVDSKVRGSLSRQAKYMVPMDKEEVAQVLKKRLIKSINEQYREETVKRYFEYLVEKRLVEDIKYKERLKESYPFHPFLIDILYDRVSTIENFNKTRGIFRLLSLVLHRIYRDRVDCKLLSPGDIPLEDSEIMDELTNRLDRGSLRPVIMTDCIEKARLLDQRRSIPIVKRVSRTIFLYSLIGAERVSGALPRDIKLGACHPGIDPGLVDEVLEEIDREFWYLKVEGGTYYFHTEPNINKIIYDYMGEVSDDEIRDVVSKKIQELLGHTLNIKVVVWDSNGLEDSHKIKLMVVDYRGLRPGEEKTVVEELLERRFGGKIREYRNTMVFLLPDLDAVQSLENSARMLCAVKKAEKDQRIVLDKEKVKRLKDREGRCEENLRIDCMNVYSKIAFPRVGDGQITIDDLHGLDGKANLTSVVFEKLKRVGKLIPESARLNPEELARILQGNKTIKVRDIYELFHKDRTKPFILSGETILETVKAGVIKGEFGYAKILEERDGKYPAVIGRSLQNVEWDGWLIEKRLVHSEPVAPRAQTPDEDTGGRQPPIIDVVTPLHEMSFQVGSLKEILKRIAEVRALSPGKSFSVELRLDIHDESRRIKIVLECGEWRALSSDVERLLNLIEKAGKYTASGYIKVASEDEGFIEELRRLVG
jgi:uncharacterized protein (UPF0305 family)